jgi:hypothetical protein
VLRLTSLAIALAKQFPVHSTIQALRLTFVGDPRVALINPAPVPKTHPQRRPGQVTLRA